MADILVIDDWPINRDFLATLLRYAGHTIREAADGAAALELVRRARPDIVITDILMPGMDGVEFAKRMAAVPEFSDIPVIFYTATYRLAEAREMASTCGVTTVLPKPSDPQHVLDAVNGELGLPLITLSPQAEGQAEPPTQPPTRELQVMHSRNLSDLQAELRSSITELASPMNGEARRLHHIVTRVESSFLGAQALAMRLATVIELGAELAGRGQPTEMMDVFCRAARDVFGAAVAAVCILDEAGKVVELVAIGLTEQQTAALRIQLGHVGGILAEVLRDGRVRNIEGRVDPIEIGFPASHPSIANLLAARIATRNRTYGWFYVASRVETAGVAASDPQLAQILAAQFGSHYENLMLFDRAKRHAALLEVEAAERKDAMARTRESELRFRQLAENINEVFFLLDAKSNTTLYISPGYARIWQRSAEMLYAQPEQWMEAVHPDDRARVAEVNARGAFDNFVNEFRIVRPDGTVRWIKARGFPIRDSSGSVYRVAGIAEDVSESKLQELSIRRLSRILRVLSSINSTIVRRHERDELLDETCRILHDEGGFPIVWIGLLQPDGSLRVAASRGLDAEIAAVLEARTKGPSDERSPLTEWRRTKGIVVRGDLRELAPELLGPVAAAALQSGCRSLAYLPLAPNNEPTGLIAIYGNEVNPFDPAETALLGELAGDVSFALQYIDKEEQLNYLAYYDPLTDLPNRTLFAERITQMLDRRPERAALFLADLDRFTHLNDSLGRHVGDRLLASVAARLREFVPEPNYLGRVGADTFAVGVSSLKTDTEAAAIMRERILAPLSRPFDIEGHEVRVSARAGVAIFPTDGESGETLLRNAEAALGGARTAGARFLFYSPQLNSRVAEDIVLEQNLRAALERREFVLHYQPKIDAKSGELVGVEALIRWQSQNGLVPPMKFIRVLEESDLILDVGQWVIEKALEDYLLWRSRGLRAVPIAVNVSPIQLRYGDFPDMVLKVLGAARSESPIEIEITESVLMADIEQNTERLRRLNENGVNIAIDDFGTGYSSLRYLAKLPVDTLKIDRSFVITMIKDPASMTLVSTIINLAHSFDLKVVAEGVDSEEQARVLRLMKCDTLQGYLFSRPVPAESLEAMLQEES
jgi:diguanylate cyclase (GGDEF)-like protein/PAS domain S-box-containing protein